MRASKPIYVYIYIRFIYLFILYTDNEENQNLIKCPSTNMYRMSNIDGQCTT